MKDKFGPIDCHHRRRGADTIAFASCIQKGTPIGYPCPFAKKMKDIIEKDLGDKVRFIDYTH